jgi:hypothetical protein
VRGGGGNSWARRDLSNVPPVGSAQPGWHGYNPKSRTDEELDRDIDPALRAGETPAQALARVRAAEAEVMARADNVYKALGDGPPKINIRDNDAANPDAHTLERHGPQIPLDAPSGVASLKSRVKGEAPWPKKENFSYRWINESIMNRVVNDYLRDNWTKIRSELALNKEYRKTFKSDGGAVGEGFYNKNYGMKKDPLPVYSQTNIVTIFLKLTTDRGPPEIRVITAFPNGRGH